MLPHNSNLFFKTRLHIDGSEKDYLMDDGKGLKSNSVSSLTLNPWMQNNWKNSKQRPKPEGNMVCV
jgi:hypothetical protein